MTNKQKKTNRHQYICDWGIVNIQYKEDVTEEFHDEITEGLYEEVEEAIMEAVNKKLRYHPKVDYLVFNL